MKNIIKQHHTRESSALPLHSSSHTIKHLLLFPILILFTAFFLNSCVETTHKAKGTPILQLPYKEINLGEGKQGSDITGEVIIQNKGTADLIIKELAASCGCTALMLEQKIIPPGEESRFAVTLDTRAKSGEVSKIVTIISNDPKNPETIVTLTATILAPKHPTFDAGKDLFNGKCRSCHYDRAGDKKGGLLYLSTCAFCHGDFGEGHQGSGPKISGSMPEDSLRYWIANGKKGTAMPGYSKAKGGPLDDEQVNSLVQFIKQRMQ